MQYSSEILFLSCYEMGHQPLSLAWPVAMLEEAGYGPTAVDLSISTLPQKAAAQAKFVGISVPMHTALRLAIQAAKQVRSLNPQAHICFYGLYAWLNADYLLNGLADSVIAGEIEESLLALVRAVLAGESPTAVPGVSTLARRAQPQMTRLSLPLPSRDTLPALSNYARYMHKGTTRLVGYTESSRGCLHTCRHCPVVPIYNGRFFAVPLEIVLADIRQQVAAGAQHITFGDPDFLNGPGHALKVAQALHDEFPQLSFDFTTKVEHILKHRAHLPQLKACGATLVISAFESIDDDILAYLDKGHMAADLDLALDILQQTDLVAQPTWVAFTPWITLFGYIDWLQWIREHELIQHVPAVQLSVRLLIPPDSALLDQSDTQDWIGLLDEANFSYAWHHPDPCMDELQRYVAILAELGGDAYTVFAAIERKAYELAQRPLPLWTPPLIAPPAPPRLTEDWFC